MVTLWHPCIGSIRLTSVVWIAHR